MQTKGTFIGWGCASVWTIDDGNDYPRLWWENRPGEIIESPSYAAGSGTPTDPYLIYTAEQLATIGMTPCHWDKHFSLMVDIDLGQYTGTAFNMIGSVDEPFTGVFDGNGHAISNFNYSSAQGSCVGLFGRVRGGTAEIRDLGMIAPRIDAAMQQSVGSLVGALELGTISGCYTDDGDVGGDTSVGGLVGRVYNGTISNCHSTGTVLGNWQIGGLVGQSNGVITESYSDSDVIGGESVGGLAGSNEGAVARCDSDGSVLGEGNVGGLVGRNGGAECDGWWRSTGRCWDEPGMIYDSYSTAGVLGTGNNSGGLVGINSAGEIAGCYAAGLVLGETEVGGFVGQNKDSISDCYSLTDVGGRANVAGLAGHNSGTVANCYSAGIVLGDENTGGLIGHNDGGEVVASFWDIETSYQSGSDGGDALSTHAMQRAAMFADAGWDWACETANGTDDIWYVREGQDYPRLTWQLVVGDFDGDGDTDFADFCIFASRWLQSDSSFFCGGGGADLTNDGEVGYGDLLVLAENWLADVE
jgi:hypothetical protein